MTDALQKTFDFLARSANPSARELLLRALDFESGVADLAVGALVKGRNSQAQRQLVERYRSLPRELQVRIEKSHSQLVDAIRQSLRDRDEHVCTSALILVLRSDDFTHLDSLLKLVLVGSAVSATASQVLASLVERLFELSQEAPHKKLEERSRIERLQESALTILEKWLPKFRTQAMLPELIDSILMLAHPRNPTAQWLLAEAEPDLVNATWARLEQSVHPGVVRFLTRALATRSIGPRAAEIISRRDDPEFVVQLLQSMPPDLCNATLSSLEKITEVAWLDSADSEPDWIPGPLQGRFLTLLNAMGLDQDTKQTMQRWMLAHGSLEGRLAAAESLAEVDEAAVERAVYDGLDSEDVGVQRWATSRLRECASPDAFTRLIGQLENSDEEVRETARGELSGFNVQMLLDLFDEMPPQLCRRAGQLVQKIDPETLGRLAEEFHHPVRQKRLRALRAAKAAGLHRQLEEELIKLLDDRDFVIRRSVIDMLGDVPSEAVEMELQRLLDDENRRIRDAAHTALKAHSRLTELIAQHESNSARDLHGLNETRLA